MTIKNSAPAVITPATDTDPDAPIVKGLVDHSGLQWVQVTYRSKSALLQYGIFSDERNSVWNCLRKQSVIVVSKLSKGQINNQVEGLDEFAPAVIFARPGWNAGQFVNASGRVFAPRGAKKGLVAFPPTAFKCAKRGSLEGWRNNVALPLVGHPIPMFFVMAAFAAPMLELSGRPGNFGFELAGEGGKGKSTTQCIMASVVGPAMEGHQRYIGTFETTPAALERSMRWHSDMPFIIDEANLFGAGESGTSDRRKMRDFAFQMASGSTKARFDSPQQEHFRFIFVTSANQPFHQRLGDAPADVADAATDRLMPIVVPPGDAGVFGPLPDGTSYRTFSLALEAAMRENYGTAMSHFLRKLVKARGDNEDHLKARIRARIDEFKQAAGVSDNNGSDTRVAEAFGLVYAAGRFAQHHKILPAEVDCLGAALHCYQNYRSSVPCRQSLPERLLAIANRAETLRIDPKNLPDLTNEQMELHGAFLRKVKGETLLLMTTTFGKRMFPDWDAIASTRDFFGLSRSSENGRGRGYRCRVRSSRPSDWFYAFVLPPELIAQLPASA